jgi:hypothetical protein
MLALIESCLHELESVEIRTTWVLSSTVIYRQMDVFWFGYLWVLLPGDK